MYAPNIGSELLRIHSIITRGLQVALQNSLMISEQGYSDAQTKEGYFCFVRCFISVLNSHHHTEDQIAFPYLKAKMLEAPYDLLMSQHQDLIHVLDQLGDVLEEAECTSESKLSCNLYMLLKRIEASWFPHISIEENYFTVDRMAALIAPEEQARMIKQFVEHSQQYMKPDFLVIPFLLYNLPQEERTLFSRAMPAILIEALVPVVWKEKWAPMKPFLIQ
jgi:hemerythrin-like domain-containing protein